MTSATGPGAGGGTGGSAAPRDWSGLARAENLARVRDFVEEACRGAGADVSTCFDLKLAVDEACTNIIEHGYAGKTPGEMRVSFAADADRLTVVISDRGRSFDPESIAEPDLEAGCESRAPGGLGWHLIRSAVDDYRYESDADGGNRLTLVKRLARSGGA